ncbi:hypothetical protein [Lysinibacillus sp. NPDC059133]|uniref:hypothetical protein n=1 Tax=Lysinibacillus sp. NPDC059133 TaxID=3346737 RepID=UPI0036C3412B
MLNNTLNMMNNNFTNPNCKDNPNNYRRVAKNTPIKLGQKDSENIIEVMLKKKKQHKISY